MVECEYCGDAFETEAAHLEHLGDEHVDELGPIDHRRVAAAGSNSSDAGLPLTGLLGGAAGLVLVVVAIWVLFLGGGGGPGAAPTGIEDDSLPEGGDEQWISQVESFESEGIQHVERGSEIDYAQSPPLSGEHWGRAIQAGFYAETPELPRLVHTLEHGAVVIYYDPASMTPEAEASLRAWADNKDRSWASIVVAPNPNENPKGDYVLTAWTHRLVIDEYDAEAVRAFTAEYIGRGPENPVR
jgi:hypothetical protein